MISEFAIVGYPTTCGGADTELYHQIKLWHKLGFKIHIIPTRKDSSNRIDFSSYPNIVVHEFKQYEACNGLHTLSFCNPTFLDDLVAIRKFARTTSWANCMTFNFKTEIVAHAKNLIDFHLYQTKHQYEMLASNLIFNKTHYIPYIFTPYFDNEAFPFIEHRDDSVYRFGRISRSDINKYAINQFYIYQKVECNKEKEAIVVGFNHPLKNRFQGINKFDFMKFYPENSMTAQDFYKTIDVVSMTTKTFENLPRVGFEAMSSGSVLVVDFRGGWKLQVEHGVTGFLCNNANQFIQATSYLGNHPDVRLKMAENAKKKLEADFSERKSASSWLTFFNTLSEKY